MPQDPSGGAPGPPTPARPGRTLVEPQGYAVTSFLTGIGLAAGIALAPRGLLLLAAALILEVIELRRLREANGWLRLDTQDEVRTFEGRTIMRYSAWNVGVTLAMGITAFVLVHTEPSNPNAITPMGDDAAAIGPALIAGVATLLFNYLVKRRLAKGPRAGDDADRMGGDPPAEEPGEPYRPANWVAGHEPEPESKADRRARRGSDRKPKVASEAGSKAVPEPDPDPELPAPYDPPAPDPNADTDDDGFRDQDYSALHGKLLEPRAKTKAKASGKRRRGDRDDA